MTQPEPAAPLPERMSATLPNIDPARAARVRERVGAVAYERWGEGGAFLDAVFASAPYLGRLAARRPATLQCLGEASPEAVIAKAIAAARAASEGEDEAAVMARLRQAKADLHLSVALADLAGAFGLEETVRAISDFADAAVKASLEAGARLAGLSGPDPDNPVPGLFILTLGKHGQRSLNYSSDIDLAVFWEPEALGELPGRDPVKTLDRLIRRVVHLLHEITAEGYVFRTDLRLRPDPSSTPLAVNADMARHYFEAVGQNWERAAYAKARHVAGDRMCGEQFLLDLEPFLWRRTVDYAAVDDIRALAKQIQSVGKRSVIKAAGHDLKLGRGGIREIEFFAQVLQLAFGGRRRGLRVPGTLAALPALADEKLITKADCEALSQAYTRLRMLEHRIQMLEDEQTQTVPGSQEARRRLAALAGEESLPGFDEALTALLGDVHARFSKQFEDGESLATQRGSLVLTGVEPTPDTLATLSAYGFSDPERVWHKLAGWAAGKARAARTERARALFSRFAPRLVEGLGATGDPDAAFTRFSSFLEGLPSGVQPLSLLVNEPELAQELITVLGLAPRLGHLLSRRPNLMDAMLDASFAVPLRDDDPARLARRFEGMGGLPFEDALNSARRGATEEKLRIGAQLLLGRATASEAGIAFARLADACVTEMARAAQEEVTRRKGPAPGQWAVLGLGKLAGRELSADSDLDLMLVYQTAADSGADADAWFVRFTQKLVSALSAPTEEGELYPVDMALRPSGSAGPIAVKLSRFQSYYESPEAWTWERMALTRTRVIADNGLGCQVETAIASILDQSADALAQRVDAVNMRARLLRDKPAASPWDLKLIEGGLIEIEFIAQIAQLTASSWISANTAEALSGLVARGLLDQGEGDRLGAAHEDYSSFIQLTRAAHGQGFDPNAASDPFLERIFNAWNVECLAALETRRETHVQAVRSVFEHRIGQLQPPATD